jgi:NAD(P)-dependent dehydrogenase (short-subunit alcohol dehydrogenase family)
MRVVVIGGMGNFGARICKRLSLEDGFTIIATGRRAGKNTAIRNVEFATLSYQSNVHPV